MAPLCLRAHKVFCASADNSFVKRIRLFRIVLSLSLSLPLHAAFNCVPDVPPAAGLIEIGRPDPDSGKSLVTGAAGAAPAGATVLLMTLETGNMVSAIAAADGSFGTSLFAPPGTTVQVKAGPVRNNVFYNDILSCFPGTFVLSGAPPAALAVSGGGMVQPFPNQVMWTFDGAVNATRFAPGDKLRLTGAMKIASPALETAGKMSAQAAIALERLSAPDGSPTLGHNTFVSMFLTPTGFPIERSANNFFSWSDFPIAKTDNAHASAVIDLSYTLPADLLPGYYRPYVAFQNFNGTPNVPANLLPLSMCCPFVGDDHSVAQTNGTFRLGPQPSALLLPIIRVGDPAPPRLFATLLTDELSNGTRGTSALEDRGVFAVASRIVTQADTFILPRNDPDTDVPIPYRLEPFALQVSVSNHIQPASIPIVPFRFPSGGLTVTIQAPSGAVTTIGPAPFVQGRNRGLTGPTGDDLNPNGGHILNAYQLSTMDPRFEVPFTEDGLHRIRLEGTVDDIWGNPWSVGGTYEVWIARPLSLDTATLPGTPFVVGDTFSPGLIVSPPGAASVTLNWQLAPNSDASKMVRGTVAGQANAFGYFQPQAAGVKLTEPGEYRVDVTAIFTDKDGRLWMGSRTWGGVVAPPNPPIVAHGHRGPEMLMLDGLQWFYKSQTGVPSNGPDHVPFPMQSGDVVWLQLDDAASPTVTFQDLTTGLGSLVSSRPNPAGPFEGPLGMNPLAISRPDGQEPHLDASKVDLWGYAYSSVQLPLVRVREEIAGGMMASPYWRLHEQNAHQLGSDAAGDMANNFKFQYGAVVLRGPAVGKPIYDIYGSLLVIVPVPDKDPMAGTRVFPPFQGNGGGPSGGPLFRFNGKDIDMFLHLTGLRPGSVLETGDTAVFAGAVAPALPAIVKYTVTAPDGTSTAYSGRANKVGYYYHPENDFAVTQPGIYTVDLRVIYDGRTSAGVVSNPLPSGDVLGAENGHFSFYVTPRGAPPLSTDLAPSAMLSQRPLDIHVTAANGHVTAMVPGFVLESRAIAGSGGVFLYRHDPQSFSPDLPIGPNLPGRNFNLVTISLFDPETNAARVLAFQELKLITMEPPQ
jgi:hypothetical protein